MTSALGTQPLSTHAKGSRRKLCPLAALAIVALIGAGCSDEPDENGSAGNANAANQEQAVEFAECMRDNGVSDFPDPPASGQLTIDGVVNGSSIDSDGAAWTTAIAACEDLQPPGFTGDEDVTASEQEERLEFAQCIRDNGVEDFPDPAEDAPLVNTNLIPSAATEAGMTALHAAMETCGDRHGDELGLGE